MQLFTNNANSTLAAALSAGATTVLLASGDGAKFPNPTGGDDFLVTVYQRVGASELNWEVMRCTARAGDSLTVVRAEEGTTAKSYNVDDLVECRLTAGAVLPVRAGALTGPLNEAATVTVASSASVAIGAARANTINLTGTATITAFDAVGAGAIRRTLFSGAMTLTHHAVSMKLPTGANIITAAGDVCEWVSLGGGNWQMLNYTRASGVALAYGLVPIANGGTGQTTAAAALAALGGAPAANPTITGVAAFDRMKVQQYLDIKTIITANATGTYPLDLATKGAFKLLMQASPVTLTFTNPPAGVDFFGFTLMVVNDATAGRSLVLPTCKWPNGQMPGRTTTANAVDFWYFWTEDGGATWYGSLNSADAR